jgi:hypothetical protein
MVKKGMPLNFMNEMKNVGLRQEEIYLFSLLGIGFWAVLTWLFVDRYQNIEDSTMRSDNIRNINIIVLSFHLLTLLFTLFESYYVNRVIWISWFTIGLALSAVFLNGVIVANSVSTNDNTLSYSKKNSESEHKDIASLVLQVFAICLMTAYIFKLIRSKKKIMY